ncbi:MAG: Sulfotransferase family protein, partial [Candidatus Kentron sp. G]
ATMSAIRHPCLIMGQCPSNFEGRNTKVRESARSEQFLDVHYKELTADPIGAVRRIYHYHGYEYSGRFEANMKNWLADNPQHKHGVHRYTLAEYGLDEKKIRQDFSDYGEWLQQLKTA